MAWNGVHMPQPQGIQPISDALSEMYRMKLERERHAADLLNQQFERGRLQKNDRQNALVRASELYKAGDHEGAKALMAQFGTAGVGEREEAPLPEWGPKLNQKEHAFADEIGQDFFARPEDRPAIPNADNPLVKLAVQDKAKQAQMAKFLTGKFEDGTPWTIDPTSGRREQQQRADEAFYQASGENSDMADVIREQYPAQRAASLAAGQPLDAKTTLNNFQNEARLRSTEKRQEAADMNRERMKLEAEERAKAEWDRQTAVRFANEKILAPMRARAAASEKPETGEGLKAEGQATRMLELAGGLDTMQPLDAKDRDIILQHAAMEEVYEKNPVARALAQKTGIYKTLAEKLSESGNAYFTQIQEIGAAILRKESGAAISAEEWRNIFQRYAPVRGDSPQVIEQKRRAMYGAIKALANESRKGGAPLKAEVDKRLGKGGGDKPAGDTPQARARARLERLKKGL